MLVFSLAWRRHRWELWERIYYTVGTVAALAFLFCLTYLMALRLNFWEKLPLAWGDVREAVRRVGSRVPGLEIAAWKEVRPGIDLGLAK